MMTTTSPDGGLDSTTVAATETVEPTLIHSLREFMMTTTTLDGDYDSTTPSGTEPIESTVALLNDTLYHTITAIEENIERDDGNPNSTVIFYTVFSALFLLGIIGNSTLIMILLRHKSMRTAPNTYIFSVALADLLTVVSCASAPLMQHTGQTLPVFCKFFQAVMETAMYVTALTLTALSIERYYAIAKPLKVKRKSKRFIAFTALFIWLVCLTYVVGKTILITHGKCAKCIQMFDPSTFACSYVVVDFIAFYVFPLVTIGFFYILMAKHLFFKDRSLFKDSVSNVSSKHLQARKKIAVTILVLAGMYAIFYFPFNFMSLTLYIDKEHARSKHWGPLTNLLFCVGCLHNSFNPVILYILSDSFRGHFNNYLFYSVFTTPKPVKEEHTDCRCIECTKKLTLKKSPKFENSKF